MGKIRKRKVKKPSYLIDHSTTTYKQLRKIVQELGCTIRVQKVPANLLPFGKDDNRVYVIEHPGIPKWIHMLRYGSDNSLVPAIAMMSIENELAHYFIICTYQVTHWFKP